MAMPSDLPATPPHPVANIELQWVRARQLEIRPCFNGHGQRVRFELKIDASGAAGTSHSRQQGSVVLDGKLLCPATARQNMQTDKQVAVHLRWWLDDRQQPDILKQITTDDLVDSSRRS
jgi:hypothetical protein